MIGACERSGGEEQAQHDGMTCGLWPNTLYGALFVWRSYGFLQARQQDISKGHRVVLTLLHFHFVIVSHYLTPAFDLLGRSTTQQKE